jgi:L-alanine-DL-glutamate epimerase-like enolase superfamily enzyme
MKITKLRCEAVHIPFPQPIGHGMSGSDGVLAYLETDEGVVGEGFICTLKREFTKVLSEMVKSLEPLVVGLDPRVSPVYRSWALPLSIAHSGICAVSKPA